MAFYNAILAEEDWYAQVRRLLQVHRPCEAEHLMRLRLTQQPQDTEAQVLIAWALYQQHRYQEGKEAAASAVALAPMQAGTHYILSLIELALGQVRAATVAIQQALCLDPITAAYHGIYAAICYQSGSFEQALAAAKAGLAFDATEANCLHWCMQALVALHHLAEAEAVGREQLRQDPTNAQAHLTLGQAALHRFDYPAAELHLRAALRTKPNLEAAQDGLKEVVKCRYWLYRASRPTHQRFMHYIQGIHLAGMSWGGKLERLIVTLVLFQFLNLATLYGSVRYRLDAQASAYLGTTGPDSWLYGCLLWGTGCIGAALLWFPMPLWAGLILVGAGLGFSLGRWHALRRFGVGSATPWVTIVLLFPAAYIFMLATDNPIGGNIFLVFFGVMLFFLPLFASGD
ncbi:MAG TPA: tetratricopeptide repeat protein [Hymenobacter sp.]|jgi:tetratricopeptide (TPR) repeat protein